MRIIDLMGSRVLTEREVWESSEEWLASFVPPSRERILQRLAVGTLFADWAVKAGLLPPAMAPQPNPADLAEVLAFFGHAQQAGHLAQEARADNALLVQVLAYEAAQARLVLQQVTEPATVLVSSEGDGDPVEVPNPAIEADAAERQAALAVLDAAGQAVLDLVALRQPADLAQAATQDQQTEA